MEGFFLYTPFFLSCIITSNLTKGGRHKGGSALCTLYEVRSNYYVPAHFTSVFFFFFFFFCFLMFIHSLLVTRDTCSTWMRRKPRRALVKFEKERTKSHGLIERTTAPLNRDSLRFCDEVCSVKGENGGQRTKKVVPQDFFGWPEA